MKRLRRLCLLVILVLIALAPLFAATYSTEAFAKLKSLAGEWEGQDEKGKPVKTNFKSIVSGTAIMETLSPTGMEDMVTVYSLDGDGIALIHFCPTNNQPRMRVVPTNGDPEALAFDFVSATNLKSPATGHQHHLVIQFEDANHITETWTWREGEMDMPMTFHLNRKK
jgi:hypothetical protein